MVEFKQERIVKYKIIYTALILLVYLICKGIPLYMIDVSAYIQKSMDAESVLIQTIIGDIHQCSIFALGISPYMIGSMLIQIVIAFRSQEMKAKISPVKLNRMTLVITLLIAVVQAFLQVQKLKFRVTGDVLLVAQVIAASEMVAGAMIILWLCSRNKKYGIGGQTPIILVNILSGISTTLRQAKIEQLFVPIAVSAVVVLITLYMENTEMRIPLQRISIHNIYADKNYMAIKFNPIGVMPAMFSMAFFMVPQMLVALLLYFRPLHPKLLWLQQNLTLEEPLGVGVYITLLYLLTLGFSRVFINPKEITDQYLKSGDSLVNIHAGRDTRRYLSRVVTCISLLSATVMCGCLLTPMMLQLAGNIEATFASLPSSSMMLTGIACNLYREVAATKDLEAYKPFI